MSVNGGPSPGTMAEASSEIGAALANGFARRMGALATALGAAPAAAHLVQQAAASVSQATSAGHVCVPLMDALESSGRSRQQLRALLLASGVVCDGALPGHALLPLVIDRQDRVYLARYYDYERQLARALAARAALADAEPERVAGAAAASLTDRLARFFGAPASEPVDLQWVAAALALTGRLTIVSGGPGTGKTTTVVGVLACLLDADPSLRVALAAPTGKAAQRMLEALQERAGNLPPELSARLPGTSHTLHRLLGSGPGGRFRHDRETPLPYDVVVVDEASMIDVALAARLVDAVAPTARLVLLGDKDQLAAVEAGAVFAELSARPTLSAARLAQVATVLGIERATLAAALPQNAMHGPVELGNPLADCVVWLERNYRFGLDSAIGRLSLAIRAGQPDLALTVLAVRAATPFESGRSVASVAPLESAGLLALPEERSVEPLEPAAALDSVAAALYEDTGSTLTDVTVARLAASFAPYASALRDWLRCAPAAGDVLGDPTPLFDALKRFRVLCAVRGGARGVDRLNIVLVAQVRRAAGVAAPFAAPWFAGRPVLVSRNDYALGLFNGDLGITLPGPDGALRVVFSDARGAYRTVSPAALPPHETAFALTVHKSQGSEFEQVALILPALFSRGLSRELLYTAITRARAQVQIVGSRAVLREAIATPTRRDSGLAARLDEALAELPARAAPSVQ